MTLIINNPEAERLAHELASRRGESIDEAVVKAMQERLERTPTLTPEQARMRDDLLAIAAEFRKLPILDPRPPDEILGYDKNGLPT
ncbi:type II toxin-antitoxin system VapB family antitoxin [Azospirillum sp.]|uniref:type II toxin-antitoxin system VapB family antitoxin n=1 Tax=Azospirillum sp. TaxID=34012 RepID=UPI003D74168E